MTELSWTRDWLDYCRRSRWDAQPLTLLVPRNYEHYNELEDEERSWNSRLRVFYVLGALIIGVAFVRERIAKVPSAV